MKTDEVKLNLSTGNIIDAKAPMIISASRATDIPAFYSKWFFNRLKSGYVRWTNPFNGKDIYVSFDKTRFIVFWSKNPEPILPYLPKLKERGIGCYFHYTLNDYVEENYEPNVPTLERRVDTFKRLVDSLGLGSVIWRFDPLLLTDKVSINTLLERIYKLYVNLRGYTEKLIFSFADIESYKKVGRNLIAHGIQYHEWSESEMLQFACLLSDMHLGLHLATCAEKVELSQYGIEHNHCIDPDLICRISPKLATEASLLKSDKGQRKLCGCINSKDIGMYNTCPHACVYCYANSSLEAAIRNFYIHNSKSDSII